MTRNLAWSVAVALLLAALPAVARAQSPEQVDEGRRLFRENCVSCHNIGGGDKTGPDLQGVTDRRANEWLQGMIGDPVGFTQSNADARALNEQYPANMALSRMLNTAEINALIEFMRAESKIERSEFHAPEQITRVITPEDVVAGRSLFFGDNRLVNGGPACVSCHHVDGEGGLGGGRLAISLTDAYARLTVTNPDALTLTIANPGFPVMQDTFKDHPVTMQEAFQINAYLKDVSQRNAQSESQEGFFLIGLLGTVLSLATFDFFWRRRLTGVRKPLVHGGK